MSPAILILIAFMVIFVVSIYRRKTLKSKVVGNRRTKQLQRMGFSPLEIVSIRLYRRGHDRDVYPMVIVPITILDGDENKTNILIGEELRFVDLGNRVMMGEVIAKTIEEHKGVSVAVFRNGTESVKLHHIINTDTIQFVSQGTYADKSLLPNYS